MKQPLSKHLKCVILRAGEDMKRLNNKGFAISTILYGILAMASLILLLLIGTMSASKKNNDTFIQQIEADLNTCVDEGTC